jgi:hypothetical protein
MQHWFVYYKLDAAEALDLAPRLREMQRQVTAACGAPSRLLRRVDDASGLATLLEVYEGIEQPPTFGSALATAVAAAGLPARLVAQRRTEIFEDF